MNVHQANPERPIPMLSKALDYARRGVPVFPCHPAPPRAKQPLTAHGVKDASRDEAVIREWWGRWPDAMIGAAMGTPSGVFAVDPDRPKEEGDPDGLAAWNALVAQHGDIPHTHTHETPSGGRHFLFKMPDGVRITNKTGALPKGIDCRGDGGYVIAAPSRMTDGRAYKMADLFDFGEFAPAPQWLVDLITADPKRAPEPEPKANPKPEHDGPNAFEQHAERESQRSAPGADPIARYVAAAVDRECSEVANCSRGGRNNRLNDAAFALGTLIGAGVLSSHEAMRALLDAASACGLTQADGERSVRATIESGMTAGAAKPRDLSGIGQQQQRRRTPQGGATTAGGSNGGGEQPSAAAASAGGNAALVTEDEGAILFAERHRGQLRYCHAHGAWFEWDGAIWRRNGTCRAFHYARELARKMVEDEPDKVKKVASKAAFAGAVEKFARADPAFAVTADVWDQNPMLLGTPAGTVDLQTGELRPARSEDGITKSAAVAPAEEADCPLWRKFLVETFAGDEALIAFAQRWAGYCLTGLTREHGLVFGYGEGGNGKSVFVNALGGIMADYAVTAAMDTFIASHGDKHSTDLAMLRGARMVTASETEEGRQWAESRVKAMTGGDPVTARFMRQDNFTFLPTFKLFIIGNHKPGLRNVDEAARRRFNLVPFTNKPAVKDLRLEEKLKGEWPGILRWAIDGCLAWQRGNLMPPESVRSATETYFGEQDTFSAWVEEDCELTPGNTHRTEFSADLYAAWQRYAKAAGEAPMIRKAFGERMQRTGAQPYKGSGGVRMYRGVALRPHARAEAQGYGG